MDCEDILELLSASLDGVLTPEQETKLQEHLDRCPSCRALLAELTGLHEVCGEMEALPPDQLKEQILESLPPQRAAKTYHWRRWGAMAATLAIVALAAWHLPHSFFQKPDSATVTMDEAADDVAPMMALSRGLPTGDTGVEEDIPVEGDANGESASDPIMEDIRAEKHVSTDEDGKNKQESQPEEDTQAPESGTSRQTETPDQGGGTLEDFSDTPYGGPSFTTLDPTFQVPIDFSHYQAAITLIDGSFEGSFPQQLQDNGELWYLLPASTLDDLSQVMGQSAYELRTEGEDLTKDASHVLLIVPAAE